MALATQRLVPSGNQGYIRNLGRSPPGTSSCVETLGERDIHAAILANPCLVCGMHSYGKGKDKPGDGSQSQVVEPGKLGA